MCDFLDGSLLQENMCNLFEDAIQSEVQRWSSLLPGTGSSESIKSTFTYLKVAKESISSFQKKKVLYNQKHFRCCNPL